MLAEEWLQPASVDQEGASDKKDIDEDDNEDDGEEEDDVAEKVEDDGDGKMTSAKKGQNRGGSLFTIGIAMVMVVMMRITIVMM